MLTLVNSQLDGTLNPTGTAFYTATLRNPYDVSVIGLEVQISLAGANPLCPITGDQISVTDIKVFYPNTEDTVPPGEEALVVATFVTNNAPATCNMIGFKVPMYVTPSISVQFQLVGAPPTFNSNMTAFKITP